MQQRLNSSKASRRIRPYTSQMINLRHPTRWKSILLKTQSIPLEVKEADDTS
jgi:hypothetical protein